MKKFLLLGVACLFINTVFAANEHLQHTVYNPVFQSGKNNYSAGTGFVTSYKNKNIFITAMHLIGEAGGFPREYKWNEVSKVVDAVGLYSVLDSKVRYLSKHVLPLKDAFSSDGEDMSGDVAAFLLGKEYKHRTLKISKNPPELKEVVFLYSRVRDSKSFLHPATVVNVTDKFLAYVFHQPGINLQATSGAPIINRKGDVLGINISSQQQGKHLIGFGNPAVSIQRYLVSAKIN